MVTTNMSAISAYQNQMKLAKSSSDAALGINTEQTGGPSFSDFLEGQVKDVVSTQNVAEAAKIDAVTGKGDITDLVTAIANAEMALNTIVTVRDKAIAAYQDIIRMPI